MVLMTGYNQPQPPPRQVGKYGRNPGHVPVGLRELTWYVAGDLPAAPAKVEPPVPPENEDGTPWGMDGNGDYGDCGVAGTDHGDIAVDVRAGLPVTKLTPQQIINYYLTYTGGVDSGVVLADFLSYVRKTGWFGKKIAGYAPVSITDYATLQFEINAYGYAYTGIAVTEQMEQAFAAGDPWTASDFLGQEVVGGHCVPLVGYDSDYLYCVTWGSIQPIQYSAWHLMSSEAWAVIWGEMPEGGLTDTGIDLAKLNADLNNLSR